jgi:hypothetical protein
MTDVVPAWLIDLFSRHTTVEDLVMSGYYYLDEEPWRVTLFGKDVFVELDSGWLAMQITKGDGSLQLNEVERPSVHEELDADDIKPVLVSLAANFLGTYIDVRCDAVTLYLNEESDLANGLVRALSLSVSHGGEVLVDPFHLDGIRIGGATDVARLLVDNPRIRTVLIDCFPSAAARP